MGSSAWEGGGGGWRGARGAGLQVFPYFMMTLVEDIVVVVQLVWCFPHATDHGGNRAGDPARIDSHSARSSRATWNSSPPTTLKISFQFVGGRAWKNRSFSLNVTEIADYQNSESVSRHKS